MNRAEQTEQTSKNSPSTKGIMGRALELVLAARATRIVGLLGLKLFLGLNILPEVVQILMTIQLLGVGRQVRRSGAPTAADAQLVVLVHSAVSQRLHLFRSTRRIGLQKPLRITHRAVVSEEIHIELSLKRLHAPMQAASRLIVHNITLVHLDLVKMSIKVVNFHFPRLADHTLSHIDDQTGSVGLLAVYVRQQSGAILIAPHAIDICQLQSDIAPLFDQSLQASLPQFLGRQNSNE